MLTNETRQMTIEHFALRSTRAPLRALGLCSALALGCASAGPDQATAQRTEDIIGGFHADSPELNHTGAVVAIDPTTQEPFAFCSAMLIGPETVVTAKHCAVVLPDAQLQGFEVAWAAGPRAQSPIELIPIASVETSPGDVGGFVAMGRDVAVLHLEYPSAITPATPAPFTDDLLGRSMVSIGYGVFGALGASDDQRRIGRETVAAVEGRPLEAMLGSFENFIEWFFTGTVTEDDFLVNFPPDDPFIASLRLQFDTLVLYDQHEAVTGLAPSDTQSCFGDSGSPLARYTRENGWQTYGVVSGGLSSLRMQCDFGTVFSTFGPQSFAFLQQALTWEDPCGDVPPTGACDGDVVQTCETNYIGNIRRIVEQDCAAEGLECVSSSEGTGCGVIPPPEEPEEPEPGAEEVVLELVRNAFRPVVGRTLTWGD